MGNEDKFNNQELNNELHSVHAGFAFFSFLEYH